MKTLTENQKTWLAALRSGDYKQGKSYLNTNYSFCCLGVACELFKTATTDKSKDPKSGITYYDGHLFKAPEYVIDALKLNSALGSRKSNYSIDSLAEYNDRGKTFAEIADIFEQNLEDYTT